MVEFLSGGVSLSEVRVRLRREGIEFSIGDLDGCYRRFYERGSLLIRFWNDRHSSGVVVSPIDRDAIGFPEALENHVRSYLAALGHMDAVCGERK